MARVPGFDARSGAYVDIRVARGFPLGGIGSGGLTLQTDGGFGELRANNNWMCPVRGLRGAFHALFAQSGDRTDTVVLRRSCPEGEYGGVRAVRGTTFAGTLPSCTLAFDDELPVRVVLHAFTPHVPHDVRDSTMPVALFRFALTNEGGAPVEAAILFSFENVLGRGGTGHLGVDLGPGQELRGVRQRVVYDSVAGNWQESVTIDGRPGVRFRTDQHFDARSHRAGVTGEYLLLAEPGPGIEVTTCDGWDAGAERASVLDDFARDGRVRSPSSGRRGADGGWRPAAAVTARTTLASGAGAELVFVLAWWTPEHVTEPSLWRHGGAGPHDGSRVGHVYETYFRSIDAVATHAIARRDRLADASAEVGSLLAESTLPAWLVRAIRNSIDSTLCNTVVPASGALYTLEGVDWHWPMGGLTGTNDQRLSAHPYTQTFFTELDLRELDEFRRLVDARGAVPHGNGNCDLGLGTTDVPYGWPMAIAGFLPANEWTDLTMSLVLQVGRLWRTTGRRDVLERFWPALTRGMDYLDDMAPRAVPEGGTTYDVWDFPGAFVYSATLYLATLRTIQALAAAIEPGRAAVYDRRWAACARRLDEDLWDARGFFRSSETRDTIFTAALAGDWAARWIGLDPVVDTGRAASHLRHQHRVLVGAAQAASAVTPALPWSEATFDGKAIEHPLRAGLPPGEEFTYVWQVVSYQACEQLYLGLVDDGLETLRLLYDRLWRDGLAWSGGLRGNGESVYMTHPVAWAVLNAVTGAALDVPGRVLRLDPRTGGELGARLRCPVFFPGFWAMLDHRPGRATTLDVVRAFGEPVEIERVVLTGAAPIEVGTTALVPGTRIELPA
jgi:non-lysosomal glucosylceramidase